MRRRALLACSLLGLGCGAPPARAPLIPEQSQRGLLFPTRFDWSPRLPQAAQPSALALGGRAAGRVALYLEFAPAFDLARVLEARLWLGTAGSPSSAIELRISRATMPLSDLQSFSPLPRAGASSVVASLSAAMDPARLDVTSLVQAAGQPGEPLGFLLVASRGDGEPVLVQTGAAGGSAPQLEVYWQ